MRKPIKREKLMAEINITPFTDVVLVLLIIFMITTPMLIQPGIKVKLPEASKAESDTEKNITILITRDGKIFIDNLNVDFESLKARITARLSANNDIPVVIKGDKEVKYDTVIKVIDTAKQSGAKKFALSVELKKTLPR
ncbi:MAG: biopolymer transporter ExbD [Elusimicrobia bacterium]|nr:biopolymer transporter ExbD [Elusimicrobiota bacterium]